MDEETYENKTPWNIIIADDQEEIHRVTKMILQDFSFEGRGLDIISAYSGEDVKHIMQARPDIAVILLDAVMDRFLQSLSMEHFDAGLGLYGLDRDRAAKWARALVAIIKNGIAGKVNGD